MKGLELNQHIKWGTGCDYVPNDHVEGLGIDGEGHRWTVVAMKLRADVLSFEASHHLAEHPSIPSALA